MLIPTMRVRYLASGHEATINVSDFDLSLHVDVRAVPAPDPADLDQTPGDISTVNSDEALDLIEKADTVEELDALEKAERAGQKHPGGRKGVLRALEARREEL